MSMSMSETIDVPAGWFRRTNNIERGKKDIDVW